MEERELPVGWCWSRLADICSRIVDGSHNPPKSSDTGLPMLSARNIENRSINLDADYRLISLGDFEHENRRTNISAGDVLLTIVGSIGRTAEVTEGLLPFTLQRSVAVLKPTEGATSRYLSYALESPDFQQFLVENSKGTAQKGIYLKALGNASIPVAPMAEQRRISAKLDTTLADVDACRQRLDGVAAILKRFRQAVLAAATSGELTREWREERGARAWTVEKATDACAKVQSGGTPKEGFIDEPGVPFLKVYNLVNQEVDFRYKPQFVRPEVHLGPLAKSRVMPGDVLMNIVGPPLGKVAIAPDDFGEWNINQAITLFRPSDKIRSRWIYCLLCEGTAIREIELRTKGSAGQVNISLTQCRDFDFPVPSIKEQDEIIERVEFFFSLAHELEAKLTAARRIADRLTPALLAKGFRGELVPQDPSDEPASVLLERIRAARQADAGASKSSGRGRKKAAALPDQLPLDAAPVPPDLLSGLLRECGALSERALLAASELDPELFQRQLAVELGTGSIRFTSEEARIALEAIAEPLIGSTFPAKETAAS